MRGFALVEALLREGFAIERRSRSFVWLARGEESILIDEDGLVAEPKAQRLLEQVRQPQRPA